MYELPAHFDKNSGNEYALLAGDETDGGGFPLGAATYVMDTLTILNTQGQSGEELVYFEILSRIGFAKGPAPTYTPFTTAPYGFPPGFPGFVYIGDSTSTNAAFIITKAVPEPALLSMLGFALVFGTRRKLR